MFDRYSHRLWCGLAVAVVSACVDDAPDRGVSAQEIAQDQLPNNTPMPNARGFAASYGNAGYVDLDNAFFTPQGTNGRHCGTCHTPANGWSINGATVTALFQATGGTHPIFASHLDTDTPVADMSTVQARWNATTMLRQGKFTRRMAPPEVRDFDVVDAHDPFGVGTVSSLFWFRRPLATATFRSHIVMWDGANTMGTDLHAGLIKQARGNVTGAQQGAPAPDAVLDEIVDYELQISHAQLYVWGAGRLDEEGAHGGPAAAAVQPIVAGRFDLYDAWQQSASPARRQVWRGQELFNNANPPSNRRCGGCHSAANNGQNVAGVMFDVGASRPELARPDMAIYTFRSRATGATVATTDPGLAIRDGKIASLGKFKVPSLRGLAARAPYFHGGIAADLPALVHHYEVALGFDFTPAQEADLVAFLEAL